VRAELQQRRDDCARDLDRQERSLQRLLDAYEAGLLDIDEFARRSDRVRAAIHRARHELTDADEKLASSIALRSIVARLESFRDRVRDGLDKLRWEDRRQLIRMLVARVEIGADGATVVYRVPPTPGSEPPRTARPERSTPDRSCRLRTQRHPAGCPNSNDEPITPSRLGSRDRRAP
jgi:site-specific DNA recombinase